VHLENVVVDAIDPQTLGRFWEGALGTETLTDEPQVFETRLAIADGAFLDLCFQPVPDPDAGLRRLRLDLAADPDQAEAVERLLGSGARRADLDQDQVPWVVLADPEGNSFRVLERRAAYGDTGPLSALRLDVGDPRRDREFWRWLTGWEPVGTSGSAALRHPSGRGPLLELCPEAAPRGPGKNRIHLDVRLAPGEDGDVVAREVAERGGREVHHDWGDLPWRFFADPSGNDFCLLPAHA